jgi:hypothetical protein
MRLLYLPAVPARLRYARGLRAKLRADRACAPCVWMRRPPDLQGKRGPGAGMDYAERTLWCGTAPVSKSPACRQTMCFRRVLQDRRRSNERGSRWEGGGRSGGVVCMRWRSPATDAKEGNGIILGSRDKPAGRCKPSLSPPSNACCSVDERGALLDQRAYEFQ